MESAKCAGSSRYQEAATMTMSKEWRYPPRICRWQKRYESVRMRAERPTDTAVCTSGWSGTVSTKIPKRFCESCKSTICCPLSEGEDSTSIRNTCTNTITFGSRTSKPTDRTKSGQRISRTYTQSRAFSTCRSSGICTTTASLPTKPGRSKR